MVEKNSALTKKRAALIGCGYWGINYLRLLSQLPEFDLIAVCDARSERLSQINDNYPLPRKYTDVNDLLQNEKIQVAIIATNPENHFEVAKFFLNAGIHVLIEKPLTVSSSESKELFDLANQKKLILMVGHTFLYNNGINKVKEILDTGDFGSLYYLYATRTNMGPIRNDVNSIWDLAPHDLSIFSYLLGEYPTEVNAVGKTFLNHDREDVGFITLKYPCGAIGNIHVSWIDPNKVRQVVVVGSKMRITFDDMSNQEPVRIYQKGVETSTHERSSFGEFKLLIRDGDIVVPKITPGEPLRNQVMHFLHCINNEEDEFCDLINGYYIVCILEAIQESIRKAGVPVQIHYD